LQVFAVDLPAHGESPGRPAATISEYAERVLDWMRAVEMAEAVICGHSMGGAVALTMALRVPRAAAALVLVGSSARLRVAEKLLQESGDRRTFPQAVDWFIEWAFSRSASEQLVERVKATALEMGQEVFHADFLASDGFDVRARLSEITKPVAVICGADDRLTPPFLSEELAAGLPAAELHLLEEAGHMVMLEQPEMVAQIVRAFVEERFPAG
jgi:pimeloyl-ACP methyl ester carboxylesterase